VIVVAYYSLGTPYEHEARLLQASLERVGMRHRIKGYPDRGDWYANTAFKPEAIREARNAVGGPMLYIDVDAYVHRDCESYFENLGTQGVDFGVHWFAGPAKGHRRHDVCRCVSGQPCNRPHRLLSGTLFFGDTRGARRLLDDWIAFNRVFRERGLTQGGGQKNLWYLTTCIEGITTADLPGRYCYVFDKKWAYPLSEQPIIEHTIASRDNRSGSRARNAARTSRKAELMRLLRQPT
jgi:hypothetical protein